PRKPGITPVTSVFAHLLGATDMAYTPGNGTKDGSRRGTAIFTRNGYTIERAVHVDVPDAGDPARRSAAVAVVQPPRGEAFSVISPHLPHRPDAAASRRRESQLRDLNRTASAIRRDDSSASRTPGGGTHRATSFPPDRIVLGGAP